MSDIDSTVTTQQPNLQEGFAAVAAWVRRLADTLAEAFNQLASAVRAYFQTRGCAASCGRPSPSVLDAARRYRREDRRRMLRMLRQQRRLAR